MEHYRVLFLLPSLYNMRSFDVQGSIRGLELYGNALLAQKIDANGHT